jgi:hypothetical protein
MITWDLPVKTISEANTKEHWSKGYKRHKKQQQYIRFAFLEHRPKITLPVQITLTRIAKRDLDKDENLPMAFKYIKDEIARCLFPGTALGQADDDPRLIWKYDQIRGSPAIRVSFECLSLASG